jgi:alanine dehydrogenase
MKIGIPVEVKDGESRVGLMPAFVKKLCEQGHELYIQKGLALRAGISDTEYEKVGAKVIATAEALYTFCDIIVKFKDFTSSELDLPFQKGQIVFTAFHLGEGEKHPDYIKRILNAGIVGISYEVMRNLDGKRTLTDQMGEIAGRMAVLLGAQYTQKQYGGSGVCMVPITGVRKPHYVILGGGHAGLAAAQIAEGLGSDVTIFEKNYMRLEYLRTMLKHAELLFWDKDNFGKILQDCDVLINAIYAVPNMELPLVTREMVRNMKKGSVIIDLEGCGLIETVHYTTINQPYYIEEDVVHFCVDNIPGMVPATANETFSRATFPFIEAVANKGLKQALTEDPVLRSAVIVKDGKITQSEVAASQGLPFNPLDLNNL